MLHIRRPRRALLRPSSLPKRRHVVCWEYIRDLRPAGRIMEVLIMRHGRVKAIARGRKGVTASVDIYDTWIGKVGAVKDIIFRSFRR